jgi:hypothetical protein
MKGITIGLVCLNVALASYFVFSVARRPAAPGASAPEQFTETGSAKPAAQRAAFTRTGNRSQGSFDWRMLGSDDLRQYVANLREVQCPEETIRDIISAEVQRRYSPRERALKVRPEDVPPWEAAGGYNRKNNEAKLRQLLEEKRSLLKDLVGIDVPVENTPATLAGRSVEKFEAAFNVLPEGKRDQVRAIQERYWTQSDEIKQRTMGFLEPEDREAFARIKTERRTDLAKVLTPREYEDYEISTSATATALKSRLEGFPATDEEYRKIFNFMQPLDEEFSLSRRSPDPEDKEFNTRRSEAERAVQDQIKSVLGEERYAEYQRTRDPMYRSLNDAGTQAGVPKESILQAYEAQKTARDESQRILRDPALTPELRSQALQTLQTTTQKAMVELLGADLAQRYGQGFGARRIAVPASSK